MTPAICTKTITVKADTNEGCSRIYGYKGNTLSNEMGDANPFEAAFRCGSRSDISTKHSPYRITIGIQMPAILEFEDNPLSVLGIGYTSRQTQKYTFTGGTDVTCAVRVGDGYSTNNSCKIHTCVGHTCTTPQTFVVTPSQNAQCTKDANVTYDIGCNENSSDYTKCAQWFYATTTPATSQRLLVNGTVQVLNCMTTTPP
jgi:hypothetical protein